MKVFKRVVCAVLAVTVLMTGAGCSRTATAYGSARGYDGKISLCARRTDEGFALTIEKSEETVGIGSTALELLVRQINEKQCLDVDVVSGATVTSDATVEAAKEALRKVGYDEEELMYSSTINDITDKSLYCDVLVIGAGGAGLTAAISAAEKGVKVIVVEKMGIPGGSTARSDGKIMAAGTPIQKYNIINDSSAGLASFLYTYAGENVESARLLDMAANSASNLDMLTTLGVRFSNVLLSAYEGQEPKRIHLISDGKDTGGGYLIEPLVRAAEANGVEIYYNTEAFTLMSSATNVVLGARARRSSGGVLSIYATSTIIATGGYDKNAELLSELAAVDAENVVSLTANGNTGDGISLAREVGANILNGAPIATLYDYVGDTNGEYKGILVNANGARFANETDEGFLLSGGLYASGSNQAYYITDRHGSHGGWDDEIEAGRILQADTVALLGSKLGAPELVSTVTSYNAMCRLGEDSIFGRPAKHMRELKDGPFYAVPYSALTYGTTGGIETNLSCAVLDEYGIIEGLYAAGEVANGVYFDYRYPGFGVSLAQAIETGRISGTRAADDALALNDAKAAAAIEAEKPPIERPYTLYPIKHYY